MTAPKSAAPRKQSKAQPLSGAMGGDLRSSLEAMRDAIAADITALRAMDPSGLAPLYRQLRDVLTQLDGLKAPEASATDELRLEREKRRAAKVPASAAKRGGQRGTRSGKAS